MFSRLLLPAFLLLCALTCAVQSGEPSAVDEGLKWLATHQEEDGHWDSTRFMANTKNDAIVTGLSLMAFLGAGHSEKVGEHKAVVKKAVAWLRQQQDAQGRIFDRTDAIRSGDEGAAVCFSILALGEAAAMSRVAETRAAAQLAVDYCGRTFPMEAKVSGGRTTYEFNPKVDTVVAGWCMFALKSAKVAGMRVDNQSFDAALKYLNSVEHKLDDGTFTYWYDPKQETGEAHSKARVFAAALVGKQFMGAKKDDLKPSVALMIEQGGMPEWDEAGEKVDLCYWWMGTLCTFQQGGDTWKQWSSALRKTLTERQRHDADFAGSWDMVGKSGKEWGRVGQTALAVMSLEIRYPTDDFGK